MGRFLNTVASAAERIIKSDLDVNAKVAKLQGLVAKLTAMRTEDNGAATDLAVVAINEAIVALGAN